MLSLAGLAAAGSMDQAALTIPLIGRLDSQAVSPALFTVILAALDSVNPVAFFVLSFLLGLLLNENSRKRMLAVGGTFIFFSGAIYYLFIAAWLNVFLLLGHLRVITIAAGAAGIIVGGMNIKGYIRGGDDGPGSSSDRPSDSIMARISRLAHSRQMASMLIGASLLAIVVNSYEMVSSLGFPLVFTRGLTLFRLSRLDYYSYLLLYCVVYVLPLAAIVLAFTLNIGANKLDGKRVRFLNLTSGMMMLLLGLVLLLSPGLLDNVFTAAMLLVVAVFSAGLLVHLRERSRPGRENIRP